MTRMLFTRLSALFDGLLAFELTLDFDDAELAAQLFVRDDRD